MNLENPMNTISNNKNKKAEEETGYERYSDTTSNTNEMNKQNISREVAKENFKKYVDFLDPTNPENNEDDDETTVESKPDVKAKPESDEDVNWADHYDPTNPENNKPTDEPEEEPFAMPPTMGQGFKTMHEQGEDENKPEKPNPKPTPEQPGDTPDVAPKPEQPPVIPTTPEKTPVKPEAPKLPEQCPQIFRQEYKTEKTKGSVWGWIKERLKGFVTFGIWEGVQAERFRRRSNAESLKLVEEAKNVDQLESLDYRSAYEEAAKMQEMAKQNGKNSKDDYEKFSNTITAEKMNSNTKEIERIMQESVLRLQEEMEKGRFQGYRTESGASVINAENMEKYQENLRDQLLALQKGTKAERGGSVPINEKEFNKMVTNLDKNYWHRYVYGGVELIIDGLVASYAIGLIPPPGTETAVTKAVTESAYTMKKGDTLWAIAQSNLVQAGVANPSNAQIMMGAKTLATANHVGVNVWGLAGTPLDTMMPVGYKVSLGALKTALPGILKMGAAGAI